VTSSSAAATVSSTWRQSVALEAAVAWLIAWVIVAALIGASGYSSRDPDSELYAALSSRMSAEPVERWIAPEWWGYWNLDGPYVEHPVGMFVVPAALGRLGYPRWQAAYAVHALYQVAVFVLAMQIAATVIPLSEARALSWLLQLMPIAFVFRVRANQEYAVLAGLLFALSATERARERPVWTAGMVAGFSAVLLVKGVFALMVPLVCALWLIARGRDLDDHLRRAPAWLGVVLMPIAGALVIWLYETAYRHVTGQSFIEIYRTKQVPEGALVAGSVLYRIAYTGTWYFSRIVWYGLPWSVPALFMLARHVRRGDWWPRQGRSSPDDDRSLARQGAWFALVAGLALAAGFSLAHRKADRYIFPVYFLIGAAGAAAAVRRVPHLARLVDRLDHPWAAPAIYVALTVLTLATSGRLPMPTLWRT
jgi:4-amino-4-deoxy-L-arabinose transferase-like glycosyltransferase